MIDRNYRSLFEDYAFLYSTFGGSAKILQSGEAWGIQRTIGPLTFEYYTGDTAPQISSCRGLRLIIWTPVFLTQAPFGWKNTWFDAGHSSYGVINLREDYKKNWHRDLFRYERNFKKSEYEIIQVTLERYEQYYELYGQPKRQLNAYKKRHVRYREKSPNTLFCYFLQHALTGDIVAGLCSIDCKSINQSYYLSGFTRKDIAPVYAGFIVLSSWIQESKEKGLSYANLGVIWSKGQDPTWKGFSNFKMKFKPSLFLPHKQFFKITWNR